MFPNPDRTTPVATSHDAHDERPATQATKAPR